MANWLTVNPTSGTAGENVVVTLTPVNENTGRLERTAQLDIKIGSNVANSITVTQNPADLFITPNNNEITLTSSTQTFDLVLTTNGYGASYTWQGTSDEYLYFQATGDTGYLGKIEGAQIVFTGNVVGNERLYAYKLFQRTFNISLKVAKDLLDGTAPLFILGSKIHLFLSNAWNGASADEKDVLKQITVTIYKKTETVIGTLPEGVVSTTEIISSELGKYQEYQIAVPHIHAPEYTGTGRTTTLRFSVTDGGEPALCNITLNQMPPTATVSQSNVTFDDSSATTVTITADNDWEIDTDNQTQIDFISE